MRRRIHAHIECNPHSFTRVLAWAGGWQFPVEFICQAIRHLLTRVLSSLQPPTQYKTLQDAQHRYWYFSWTNILTKWRDAQRQLCDTFSAVESESRVRLRLISVWLWGFGVMVPSPVPGQCHLMIMSNITKLIILGGTVVDNWKPRQRLEKTGFILMISRSDKYLVGIKH